MTKEEFLDRYNKIKHPIIEKYGFFIWYLAESLFNIRVMEDICINAGFRVERKNVDYMMYSKVFDGDVLIAHIECQGLPSIELYKGKRKYSKLLSKDLNIIEPIKGVHRILDWHTVKGKNHCLAGGETVLHLNPVEITDEMMMDFVTKVNLLDKIEEFKKKEKDDLIT